MPCPRCHGHRLWDDNLAWGCHDCEFFTTGEIRNSGSLFDRFLTHDEAKAEVQFKPEGNRGRFVCNDCGRVVSTPSAEEAAKSCRAGRICTERGGH